MMSIDIQMIGDYTLEVERHPNATDHNLHGRFFMAHQKFLVTGATGATGVHAVELLLARGHQVRALAHREDDRSKQLQELGAEVVIGDLLKLNDVRLALIGIRGAYFVYLLSPTLVQATA